MTAFCLNLCELVSHDHDSQWLTRLVARAAEANGGQCLRLYAGSYFCARYFVAFPFWRPVACVCRELSVPLSLVVPVASQSLLAKEKEVLGVALTELGGIVDEVTVNDPGMLSYLSGGLSGGERGVRNVRVNAGRLFFKDLRDVRIPGERDRMAQVAGLDRIHGGRYAGKLEDGSGGFAVQSAEIDQLSNFLALPRPEDLSCEIALHVPFVYMSTGMVCKYGSIHRELKLKFRPNGGCGLECQHVIERTHGDFCGADVDLFRVGRTIFALPQRSCATSRPVERSIYFPLREAIQMSGEH